MTILLIAVLLGLFVAGYVVATIALSSQRNSRWVQKPQRVQLEDLWCPHCGRADGKHENGYSCSQ